MWDQYYEHERKSVWAHLTRRHKVSRVARSASELALPLHAKPVGELNLQQSMDWMAKADQQRLIKMLASTSVVSGGAHKLLAPADDAAELVRAGYCEEWQPSGQYSPLEYFSVIEIDKNRRRPIFWPKRLLSQSTYQSAFTLPSVDQYRKTVHAGNWAVAFDLSASFAQVALPAESRLAFKSSDGKLYRLRRLPYGIDVAPEIMQLITECLAQRAAEGLSVTLRIHIDNAMAVGERPAVEAWARQFKHLCQKASVTLNEEESNTPAQQIEFVGIRFDFAQKRVSLKPRFVAKVRDANDDTTHEEFESLMGRLTYAYAVLGRSWLPLYFMIKWWRRRLSALAKGERRWDERLNAPPFVRAAVSTAVGVVQRNRPVDVQLDTAPQTVLATDASKAGWGAVLMRRGSLPLSFGAKFDVPQENITLAETAAVLGAFERFTADLEGTTFTLLVDNTSTEAVLRSRKPGRSLAHAAVASSVLQRLVQLRATMYVTRVDTAANVADEVSRGRRIDSAKARECLELGVAYDWAKG